MQHLHRGDKSRRFAIHVRDQEMVTLVRNERLSGGRANRVIKQPTGLANPVLISGT